MDKLVAQDFAALPVALRRPRRRGKRLVAAAAALLMLGAAGTYGGYWWDTGRFLVSTDDAYVGGDITVIAAKIAGYVAEVRVADNEAVRAGDVLVRIDDRDARATLASAEADVAERLAAIDNLAATRALQDAVIAEARAELDAATAEDARTLPDVARYQTLAAKDFASRQRFEQADADAKKAVAAVAKARATLDAAQRQIAVIETQQRRATAARDAALAQRDLAGITLDDTIVRAPVDGVIGNRSARTGSYATEGQGLMALVPARGLWIDANFKESQLAAMKPGQPARVVADISGESFAGHVASLAPATGAQFSILPPENATGNFTKIVQRVPVRILLDGEAGTLGRLRPGLSVTATVDGRVP